MNGDLGRELCHKCLCGLVPFEIDSAGYIGVGAVQFGPAGVAAGDFLPQYDQLILFQAAVVGYRLTQAAAVVAGYLYYSLHFLISFGLPALLCS